MNAPLNPQFRLLGTYLAPQRRRIAGLAVLMLADLALQLALPRVAQQFIDGALAGAALQALISIGVGYLTVAITKKLNVGRLALCRPKHRPHRHQSHPGRSNVALPQARHELSQRPHAGRDDRAH